MKYKVALGSLLVLLLLSAFSQNPKPLFALPLPEGRTLDEGHDSGFIDWSGGVSYINLNHRDGICPSGCVEQVTRISNGGAVSGAFAPVDVAYFEVMVAFTHNSGTGTAVLNACGSSAAWNLYVGPGSGLPGFVSMPISVPSGCTSWSLSASGGYVDFRSVDANYVSPPPPVATNTFTPLPTATFTPSPTATQTPASTDMFTPTLTATETPTATETLAPGVTPSDTPSPTLTSTPSATLPPGVTPSDTPVPTDTPIPPAPTNTPVQPPSSGSGQGGSGGFVLPTATATPTTLQPTFTHTPVTAFGIVSVTPNLVETARVMIFGTSTPTPTPRAASGAGKSGSSFPWWLLAAGGAAAYAVSKRKQIAANLTKGQKGGARLSASPSGDCPWWNLICQWKAKKRLEELIKQANGNGAEAIISIMGDTNLPGQNAQKRLDWVLRHTRGGLIRKGKYQGHSGSGWTPLGQFKYHFGLDDGLAPGFQDSWLYCNWDRKPNEICSNPKTVEKYRPNSNQVGHFLSAVDMANRGDFGLRLTVAHEKWGDTAGGQAQQLLATVVPDWVKQPVHLNLFGRHITIPNPLKKYDLSDSLNHWSEAQTYDELYLQTSDLRYRQLRDQHLRGILGGNTTSQDPARKGNSLQDLRLSLRGFEFNDWVKANPKAFPSQTAEQLRRLITSDSHQSGRNVDKRFPHPIPR